jgi:drug/metabolite transporter (DMT)-like permease
MSSFSSFAMAVSLAIAMIWGGQAIVMKNMLRRFHPITVIVVMNFLYFLAAFITFSLDHKQVLRNIHEDMTWEYLGMFFLASVVCGFAANMVYTFLLQQNTTYIVVAITFCAPIFTVLLSWLFLHEERKSITPVHILGVLLTVAGIMCISYGNPVEGMILSNNIFPE